MPEELPAELREALGDLPPSVAPNEATTETLNALVDELIALKRQSAELEALTKEVTARYDDVRKRRLPELMQALGMVSESGKGGFTHRSGAKIHLRVETYASVRKEQQDAFYTWLRLHGHEDLIRETVYNATLKAFVKELQRDGEAIPPQVDTYLETIAVLKQPKTDGDDE